MATPFPTYLPHGVIPACLLPFHDDLSVDAAAYRAHIRDVGATRGITAITVNAHASEVSSCDVEEQDQILDLTLQEIGDRLPVIAGVYADGSMQAARLAKRAASGGASALLLFPPNVLSRGAQQRPENLAAHVKAVADATDLPLIIFQYAMATGLTYPLPTLLRLAEEVPTFRALKDGCADPVLHERTVVALQGLKRPVNVLSTHSAWLLGSLAAGCNGLLSGSGSVIAALHVEIYEAIRRGDMAAAHAANALIAPTAEVFYAAPLFDMHNRMKEALVMLGRMPRATVRPPLRKLADAEIARIRTAIQAAGLLDRDRAAAE
jgi:4-hydroxy-tetrahydrodipicolinate synthase